VRLGASLSGDGRRRPGGADSYKESEGPRQRTPPAEHWQRQARRVTRFHLVTLAVLVAALVAAPFAGLPLFPAIAWLFRACIFLAGLAIAFLGWLTLPLAITLVIPLCLLFLWYPRHRLRVNLAHELAGAAPTVTLKPDFGAQGGQIFGHRRVEPRTAHPHLVGWPRVKSGWIRWDRGHWEFTDDFRKKTEALLNARLGGEHAIRWFPTVHTCSFRRRKPWPKVAVLEPRHLFPNDPDILVEGIGLDDVLVTSDIGEGGHPWGLVVAPPGSGKTSHLVSKTAQYLAKGYEVWVFDVKRELEWLADLNPARVHVAHTLRQCEVNVKLLNQAMWKWIDTPVGQKSDRIFHAIIVDECTNWFEMARADHKDNGGKARTDPPVLTKLFELFRMGRRAGFRGDVSTQRPDAKFLEGEFRSFFTRKTVTAAMDLQGSVMVTGDKRATEIPKQRGRGMHMVNYESELVQLLYVADMSVFDRWR
jgi:hypothetical protein